jgi:lipopolysaccharide export system permease protein
MQFLWKWVDELVGKGLDWHIVTELFFYASMSVVPLAIPMAVLLSSLMTFGNLAEHYELAALKSSGLSLMKIMRPLIFLVVGTTVLAFLFSNYVLPYTNLKMYSTLFDIRQQKPALNIKEGIFYNEIEDYSIRISKISSDKISLEGVMIYDHTERMGNTTLTMAKTGEMFMTEDKRYLMISLHDGMSYKEYMNTTNAAQRKPLIRAKFADQLLRLDLSGFEMQRTQEDLFKDNHQMLNGEQLLEYIDTVKEEIIKDKMMFYSSIQSAYFSRSKSYWQLADSLQMEPGTGELFTTFNKEEKLRVFDNALNTARNCKASAEYKVNEIEAEEKSIVRFEVEFWKKYSLSFACLIMFFVGAQLGAIIRKGGLGLPVVFAVVFFILFWIVTITFEKLSLKNTMPPSIGMWMGCIVFIPIAYLLTKKATADAGLFDIDSLFASFLKFFKRKSK